MLGHYPHQLSGGMLQRAMIAMALSCRPKLLIADEPTTALDVTIQAQILQLIKDLQAELGMALIMITHDLGVIAETVDRVVVMYGGKVMEEGPVRPIFDAPAHSYTKSLLDSLTGRRSRSSRPEPSSEATRRRSSFATVQELSSCKQRGRIVRQRDRRSTPVRRRQALIIPEGSIVGLVGESGSGKSTTGMMAMRLVEPTSGQVLVNGEDISFDSAGDDLKPSRQRCRWCSRTATRRSIR